MRNKLTLAVLCALTVALRAEFGDAQTPPPPPPPPGMQSAQAKPPVGTGMVLGTVVDSSGSPVAGAVVTIRELRVFTNGEGRFLFTNLAKGNYSVNVAKPGFLPGAYGRTRPNGQPQTLELQEGERIGTVRITLWRSGSISGVVYDEAGEPLVGVPIWSLERSYAKGRAYWNDGPSATTDDRGFYRLADLSPADYALCVVNAQSTMPAALVDAYAAARIAGTTSELSQQYSTQTIGFSARLPTAGIRMGDSVLHTVGPFAGGMIPPTPGEDGVIYSFRTTCAPNAIGPTNSEVVTLAAGEERTGADIRLTLVPGTLIEGTILGPEGPEPNVGVRLSAEWAADLNNEQTWEAALTMSDARGRFTFLGVPAGRYVLRALKAPRGQTPPIIFGSDGIARQAAVPPMPPDPTLFTNMPIVVGPEGLANVAVRLATGFRLTGRLQFDGKTTKPTPQQLQGARVILEHADGHSLGFPLSTRVNADGTFTTFQVPGGRYLLRVATGSVSGGWTFKAAMSEGRDISDRAFDLQGDVSNVAVIFTDAPSELSGLVRDETGRIDSSAGVVVFSADRRDWSNFGEFSRRVTYARPSMSGRWSRSGLPPGEYFVAAIDDTNSANWQDPRVLEAISRIAERVTLTDGERKSIDLQAKAIR